jgi:hypothetical protein
LLSYAEPQHSQAKYVFPFFVIFSTILSKSACQLA